MFVCLFSFFFFLWNAVNATIVEPRTSGPILTGGCISVVSDKKMTTFMSEKCGLYEKLVMKECVFVFLVYMKKMVVVL